MLTKRTFHIFIGMFFCVILWPDMLHSQSDSGVVSITSNVIGANIYYDSLFLGVTPLSQVLLPSGKHTIMVIEGTPFQWNTHRKEQSVEIVGGSLLELHYDFSIDSVSDLHSKCTIQHDVLVNPHKIEFHPFIAIGSGVGVAGGIAAAYFKIKANAYYDAYLSTGDRESLRETHRFDTMAAVTLALSQIGLVIVAYCLLSE